MELRSEVTGSGGYLTPDAVGELVGPEFAAAAQPCLVGNEVAVFNPGSEVALVAD